MDSIAIIPCKEFSSRLPGKNFLQLDTKPLWRHTLDFLVSTNLHDQIVISTDNPNLFPESLPNNVTLFHRIDKHTSSAHSFFVVDEYLKASGLYAHDSLIVSMALPTAPLRKHKKYHDAHNMMFNGASSVIGVKRSSLLPSSFRIINDLDGTLEPLEGSSYINNKWLQSTDIAYYQVTGTIFLSKVSSLKTYQSFHSPNSQPIVLGERESLDINSEDDFRFAQYLYGLPS